MRVAFDIGGVLSKYPSAFRTLVSQLSSTSAFELFVITDMPDVDKIYETLVLNGFFSFKKENIHSADYATHGEGCKAELLRELQIDLFFDDFMGYLMIPGNTIRCLVMPDPGKPYYSDEWKVPAGEFDFGRRKYSK